MPRSQSVRLNKAPVTEVSAATFDSDVVQTQQFASVKSAKTPGQQLAEAVGMVAKGATSVLESRNKAIENEEIINWSLYGDQVGRKMMEDLVDKPLDERSAYISAQLEAFRGDFEKYSDGRGVSAGGFRAGFGAFTEYVGRGEAQISEARIKIKLRRQIAGISNHMKTLVSEGKDLKEIMQYAAGNKELFFDDREAQVETIRVMQELANVHMNANPMEDIEPFIQKHMTGKSLDGSVNLYSIKEIKNIVDNVRKDNRANRSAYSAKTLENKKAYIFEHKSRDDNELAKWKEEGIITPYMEETLRSDIRTNLSEYHEVNRDAYYNGILEGTHGLKELNQALKRKEITVPQHNSLTAEYHSSVARQSTKNIFQSLTADLSDNMTYGRYQELLGKQHADGGYIYKPEHVKKAYKAVLQNDYNRIARGGFKDLAGASRLFANSANVVKLDGFEKQLSNLTVTIDGKQGQSIQDVINSNLSSTQKNSLVYGKMKHTSALVNIARASGYRSANMVNFEKDYAILRAELTINSNEGLQNYVQNTGSKDRNRVAGSPEIQRAMKMYTGDLYGEDDAEYRIIQAPFMNDIYNVVRNRPNSSEVIAAQQTAEFIRRTMVQVDVQGSGITDDQIWVSRETGITGQDSYDHVTESLAEYFGVEDDDLQLYNMNPADPDSSWYFRNLGSQQSVKVPVQLIRLLSSSNEQNWRDSFIKSGYGATYTKPKNKGQLDFKEK